MSPGSACSVEISIRAISNAPSYHSSDRLSKYSGDYHKSPGIFIAP